MNTVPQKTLLSLYDKLFSHHVLIVSFFNMANEEHVRRENNVWYIGKIPRLEIENAFKRASEMSEKSSRSRAALVRGNIVNPCFVRIAFLDALTFLSAVNTFAQLVGFSPLKCPQLEDGRIRYRK